MDGFGSGSNQRTLAVDRWVEIVNGKGYGVGGSSQFHSTRSDSSDLRPSIPPPPGSSTTTRTTAPWRLIDPETRRKKRIAMYMAYGMEAKVKSTVKKGFRWFKKIING